MVTPFLLRFAQPCLSPDRAPKNSEYKYDESIDMMRWIGSPEQPTVVEVYRLGTLTNGPKDPPVTKKCDLEKGEDQKDRRMWKRV